MSSLTFTIPSVLNQGGGEKKVEVSADTLSDAFSKVSETMGDDFKRLNSIGLDENSAGICVSCDNFSFNNFFVCFQYLTC